MRKPNPQQIQKIFEWFAELLTNTTREVVAPAMRAAAVDLCDPNEPDQIFTADTRELMGFFVTLRKLLLECGIRDFTFSDLYKPTHPRLVRIFSYIINFIRFRESQTGVIDEHYNSSENTKNMIEQLYNENQEKAERLQEMQHNRKNVEQAIKEKEKRREDLITRLIELQRIQKQVTDKREHMQEEQARLKSVLEDKATAVMNTRQEAAKLRPYTEQSPAVLEQALRDLSNNLSNDKAEIDRLDKRTRALQTSFDSFSAVISDLTTLQRVLTDLQTELGREVDEAVTAAKTREALGEQTNTVREVELEERRLRKQLDHWQGKTEKVRRDAEVKAGDAKQKMEALRGTHRELTAEREERRVEIEKKRVRIEQTEKKVRTICLIILQFGVLLIIL